MVAKAGATPKRLRMLVTEAPFGDRIKNDAEDDETRRYYKGGRFEFPDNEDVYTIEFRLAGQLKGWTFAEDPFWLGDGDHCPTDGSYKNDDFAVIEQRPRPEAATTIVVRNDNTVEGKYRYQLNLIDDEGNPQTLDPVILNGGGGKPSF